MRIAIVIVCIVSVVCFYSAGALAQNYIAMIDGAQVPTASAGTGLGCLTLDSSKMLSYEIVFSGLTGTETVAHIHGPAAAGVNAGVVFPFSLGSPKIGVFGPLTAQQEADLNNDLYYVNIHSSVNPGGEIRGQILVTTEACSVPTEEQTWGGIKAVFEAE